MGDYEKHVRMTGLLGNLPNLYLGKICRRKQICLLKGGKGMEEEDKDCLLTLNTFFVVAKDRLAYLRVKFASIVQERHADLLQPPYLAGVILKALEHTTADISCTHQAVLDLSWKERTGGGDV